MFSKTKRRLVFTSWLKTEWSAKVCTAVGPNPQPELLRFKRWHSVLRRRTQVSTRDQRHAREEHVIETAAGQVRSASTGPGIFRSCGHSSARAVRIVLAPGGVAAIVGSMTRFCNVGTGQLQAL